MDVICDEESDAVSKKAVALSERESARSKQTTGHGGTGGLNGQEQEQHIPDASKRSSKLHYSCLHNAREVQLSYSR